MKRTSLAAAVLFVSGCQLSAIPQLFAPPKNSGHPAASASTAPGMPGPRVTGAPASSSGQLTLTVDGVPATILGTLTGSGGSYSQETEGALSDSQWTVKFSLSPESALQTNPIDASALTFSGSFIVGNPGGSSGRIRQYISTAVTKITQRDSLTLSVTQANGKLDVAYAVSLTPIPSDGLPAKRFVLTGTGLPL